MAACLRALDGLDLGKIRSAVYDGSFEDLFFLMERELVAEVGPEVAGKMHTARSRNDIDLTMYRMVLREWLAATMSSLLAVRKRLRRGLMKRQNAATRPTNMRTPPLASSSRLSTCSARPSEARQQFIQEATTAANRHLGTPYPSDDQAAGIRQAYRRLGARAQ